MDPSETKSPDVKRPRRDDVLVLVYLAVVGGSWGKVGEGGVRGCS